MDFFPERVEVVDVGRDGVDGDDAGRRRADQAEIARQQERPVEAARRPVPRRAERGREILGTPHHAPQPRAHVLEVEQLEDGPRRLGRHRDDARRAMLDPGGSLECIEIQRQPVDVGSAGAFRQHDAVGPARHDGREVAKRHAGIERVDANIDLLARIPRIEHLAHRAPRADLLVRRDRILEIEDQRVGRGLLGVFELALAVAGNEQE